MSRPTAWWSPTSLQELLALKASLGERGRIVTGASEAGGGGRQAAPLAEPPRHPLSPAARSPSRRGTSAAPQTRNPVSRCKAVLPALVAFACRRCSEDTARCRAPTRSPLWSCTTRYLSPSRVPQLVVRAPPGDGAGRPQLGLCPRRVPDHVPQACEDGAKGLTLGACAPLSDVEALCEAAGRARPGGRRRGGGGRGRGEEGRRGGGEGEEEGRGGERSDGTRGDTPTLCGSGCEGEAARACATMLRWFASTQIRNVASLGGNIATASPISDMIPTLLACGASLTAASEARGERTVPLAGFVTGYRRVALEPDEVCAESRTRVGRWCRRSPRT